MPQSAIPPSRHAPIRQVWLNSCREEIIEPDLPIVDTQHHMPDQRGNRYLFQDLLADVGSGHNIIATCVNGIAPMSANGKYGPTRRIAVKCSSPTAPRQTGHRFLPWQPQARPIPGTASPVVFTQNSASGANTQSRYPNRVGICAADLPGR